MKEEQVRQPLSSAIAAIQKEVRPLEYRRVHERSIAHRLAVHMEPYFCEEWDVDCEYDRDGQIQKTLGSISDCRKTPTDLILPDIIVHHRNNRGHHHNLLVIEIKKDDERDPCDQEKLKLLTEQKGQYQYQLGLYINIDGGKFSCTWYREGQRQE